MKKMTNIYYKIWVDCIVRLRAQEKNKDIWQRFSMIIMSIAMTFNLLLFMAILQRDILGYTFYEINLSFLPDRENNLLTILILLFSPCVIVNYLLVFRKKRCKKLIRKYKYPYYNGKLAITYIMVSLFLPVILMFIGMLL